MSETAVAETIFNANTQKSLHKGKFFLTLHSLRKYGAMAEGLGTGLQNLLQQFESAWHLQKKSSRKRALFFYDCLETLHVVLSVANILRMCGFSYFLCMFVTFQQ